MSFMLQEINRVIDKNKDYIEEKTTPGSGLAFSGIFGFLTANVALEYIKNNWMTLDIPADMVKINGFIDNIMNAMGFRDKIPGTISDLSKLNLPLEMNTVIYSISTIRTLSGIVAAYGIGKMIFSFIEKLRDYKAESERIKIDLKHSKLTKDQIEKYNQLANNVQLAGLKAKQEIEDLSVNTKKLKLEIDQLESRSDDLSFKELQDLEKKRTKLIAHGVMLKKLEDLTNTTN